MGQITVKPTRKQHGGNVCRGAIICLFVSSLQI
jgi:hypothetical protein